MCVCVCVCVCVYLKLRVIRLILLQDSTVSSTDSFKQKNLVHGHNYPLGTKILEIMFSASSCYVNNYTEYSLVV